MPLSFSQIRQNSIQLVNVNLHGALHALLEQTVSSCCNLAACLEGIRTGDRSLKLHLFDVALRECHERDKSHNGGTSEHLFSGVVAISFPSSVHLRPAHFLRRRQQVRPTIRMEKDMSAIASHSRSFFMDA